jgi:ATP-binding cassette, subfamily B, bacterial CvaB/MchF/RaxB
MRVAWVPELVQETVAECGLVCLAMVAAHHGAHHSLTTLRARFAVSLHGASLEELESGADLLELSAEALTLADETDPLTALRRLAPPVILHWSTRGTRQGNHFVVYRGASRRYAIINDPASGRRHVTWAEVDRCWTGVVLRATPKLGFTKQRERRFRLRSIADLPGLNATLGKIFLLALPIELLNLLQSSLNAWLIDEAFPDADRNLVWLITAALVVMLMFRSTLTLATNYLANALAARLALRMQRNVAGHLLALPLGYFQTRTTGDLMGRLNALGQVQSMFSGTTIELMMSGAIGLLTLGIMTFYSVELAAIVAGLSGLYAIQRMLRYPALRNASQGQWQRTVRQQTYFLETLRAMATIKAFNQTEARLGQFLKLAADTLHQSLVVANQLANWQVVSDAVGLLDQVGLTVLGALLVLDHQITIGVFVAALGYKDQFVRRSNSLVDQLLNMRRAVQVQGSRLQDVMETAPEVRLARPYLSVAPLVPSIEARGIGFRYSEADPWIFRNLSLRIEAEEFVAIVGPSGCGKSTLFRVLAGQIAPSEGELLLGGIEATRLGLHAYRAQVGIVQQDDTLLAGTIGENIAYSDASPNQTRIEECARLACVHEAIMRKPMSYNSLVGDHGSSLSGGERQRVFLARALYKRPSVLLIDEGTAHLDTEVERQINAKLGALRLTRIIIAHRPQAIEAADRVVPLRVLWP